MQLQAIFVICLAMSAFAANETTNAEPIDCGLGTGIGALLEQIANILDGILANEENIRMAGVASDSGDLENLKNLMIEVRDKVYSLSGRPDPNTTTAERDGQVSSIISQLTTVLDSLLGAGSGQKMACQSGGELGNLAHSSLAGVGNPGRNNPRNLWISVGPIVTPVTDAVVEIVRGLK